MEQVNRPASANCSPDNEICSVRQSISTLILRSGDNNQQLVQGLRQLESGYSFMTQIAPHYDLSINSPGNGVRSFVKVVQRLVKQLDCKLSHPGNATSAKKQDEVMKSVSFVNALIRLLHLIEEKRLALDAGDAGDDSVIGIVNQSNSSIDHVISSTLLSLDRESTSAFLSLKPFWLTPSMNLFDELYARLITFRIGPMHNFLSVLIPKKVVEGNVDFTMNCNFNDIRNVWSFYGWKVMRPFVSTVNLFKPKIRKIIEIPRQDLFYIDVNGVKVRGYPAVAAQRKDGVNDHLGSSKKVSCLFLHDNTSGSSPSDCLLVHLHGGGYITMKPKCHEIYLRRWASRLRGVPILSIDYSLSPENPYPVALQEILDVYLFLNGYDLPLLGNQTQQQHEARVKSNCDEIISLIGFKPKNIVLYGDSAGGNLTVALMHVLRSLNELLLANNNNRNNNNDHQVMESVKIPYPRSVVLLYPHMSPTVTRFSPSRLFMAFDPVLPLGTMFALSEAYHPQSQAHDNDYNDLHGSRSNRKKKDPWYRKSSRNQRLREIQETDLGHFFNPLCGKFDAFRDIPLFIQVGEFDPLFDDAICLAKKWKGRVKLDILEGLTHGFLFNGNFSGACKKAIDLANERLLQAIFGQ